MNDFSEKCHKLSNIKKVIGIVSGKGGVGKSLVTSMMAVTMQRRGYKAAILDADITGPSIPKSFGIKEKAYATETGIYPIKSNYKKEDFLDNDEEVSAIPRKEFELEKNELQVELLKMQEWLKDSEKSVIIVFEGRDTAGKGSTIKKFTEYLDPKFFKIVTKGIPSEEEKKNWFERYRKDIEPGKIIFFDRSWYNRGVVEPVMGYSTYNEYEEFMVNVNKFEEELIDSGNYLIKFWLSITKDTQVRRFNIRKSSPLKYWKYSPNDAKAQEKWDEYTSYKKRMFRVTSTNKSPWVIVDSNDKRISGLNSIRYVLSKVPYINKNDDLLNIEYPESITTIK
jgi:polyphosphate kinase 2